VSSTRHAAIDLGASSGRVVVADIGPGRLELTDVHRFANRPVRLTDGLHWDVLGLYRAALDGLARAGELATIGVDSWAVDYGLLDASGALLGNPYHYRDNRTDAVVDKVHGRLPFPDLYALNGLQLLPFNTVYQLAAAEGTPQLELAQTLLLVPDLVGYWLTGQIGAEVTNASTTGLLDVRTRQWSPSVLTALGLRASLLPPLRQPGDLLGPLLPAAREETGLGSSTAVVAVGSHDTASAVLAVPMQGSRSAYVSLGTWGLVGVELDAPVLSDASREANFTNELGVDGRVRYLRNVMGLWLLQESMRVWGSRVQDLAALLAEAAGLPKAAVFDVDDARLLPPGDMPARIRALTEESGQSPPSQPVQVVRSILDSLALALARTVHDAARLSGRGVDTVHVVGGGAQNALLCQLLADAAELPVIAGPVEATALGNVLVQARAHGTISGDLDELRQLVRETHVLTRYEPRA
jgi:rhamnulokinase